MNAFKRTFSTLALAILILQLSGVGAVTINNLQTEAAIKQPLSKQDKTLNAQGKSYESGWIDLANDSNVSGPREKVNGFQGGFNSDYVRYVQQGSDKIVVQLDLAPGDYEFVYGARYGQYNPDFYHESNENLRFKFGSRIVNINDPDQDESRFRAWESSDTLVDQSFTLTQSIKEFSIEGLGNRVDFGEILITGQTTPAQNDPPTCTVSANPNSGQAPLASTFTVTTDARGAGDSIAHFAFNVGDPDQWFGYSYDNDPAYNKDPAGTHGPYTYNNKGTYRVELKVWDTLGQMGTCSTTVNVKEANYKLTVSKMASPSNTHFYWNDGEEIGKTFTYTMRYNNYSNVALEKVYAFDEFYRTQGNLKDALLDNLKCSPSKNTEATAACQIMDIIRPGQEPFKVIYWNLGTLQPGESGYIKLEGKVKDLAPNWVEGYLLQNDIYIRDAWEGQDSTPNIEADDHVDQWLHINGLPSCTISVSPDHGPKELNVDFRMSATDDIEIKRWSLNTGNQNFSGNGMPPSVKNYTYTQIGEYVPELTVYDNNNVSARCETQVKVIAPPIQPLAKNNPPECEIVAQPTKGEAPFNTEFMMRARDDKGISSWNLTTGDGQTFSGAGEPPHFQKYTYQNARKTPYTGTLTVYDTNNVSAICTDQVIVTAGPVVDTGITALNIKKLIRSSSTSKYEDANTSSTALDLGEVIGSKAAYYRVEVQNAGDREASNVRIKDTFTKGNNGTNLVDISSVDGASYDSSNNTFTISKIAGYSTKSFTYKATIKAPAQGDKEITDLAHNTATIQAFDSTAPNQSGVGEQDPAYLKLSVPALPLVTEDKSVLTIDKSVVPASPSPANIAGENGSANYTIKITNTVTSGDGVDATKVKIRDVYSSTSVSIPKTYHNVSGASWDGSYFTLNKVSKGSTATITYTVDFDTSNLPENGQVYLTNTATLVSADGTSIGSPKEDQATVKLLGPGETSDASFSIKKDVEDDKLTVSEAEDQEDLDYTITVTNTSDVEGEVRVTDTLKNGTIAGTDGGEFSYNNDLRVSGAISYSGDLDETDGVLLRIAAHREVTLKYSVSMDDLDEIDSDDESKFRNTARLSSGQEASVTVRIKAEEPDFSIKKTISNSRDLRHGDIVTYEIEIKNIGESKATVEVTDSISKLRLGGTYYLAGKNGGRLEYIPDSMKVDGISKKNVNGKITSRNGVELEDVDTDDEVTISYKMRVVIDGLRAGTSSVVENEACVEFGDDEECDDAKLTIVAGYTPVPPLPPLPPAPLPPTPVTPVVPAIIIPPTYVKTGAAAAALPAGLATSLGALISLYIRKRRLLGL